VPCLREFRSSAPSDLLPSSPGGRPSGECGGTRSKENGGSAPVAECRTEDLPGWEIARQAHPGRHGAGAGPLSEAGRTMREYPSSALLGALVSLGRGRR
jgi:hypothetical protein